MLARGGHAVDAAIAANAVLGLVEPYMNGMGGDLFAMVYEAGRDALHGLNASGPAPGGLSPDLLRRRGMAAMPATGIHSVTVPGAVAGWAALHARFGRLPLADVLAPAVFYAENGFPVAPVVAEGWAALEDAVAGDPTAAATYLPGGQAPAAGTIFRNPDLARSLRLVGEHGAGAFYRGPIADAIVSLSQASGGTMTAADLSSFEPEWVEPVSTTYRGWTVYELPPNTQGIAALMMLDLMETSPLARYGLHSVDALHTMIEAKKLAYADMLRWVGDPRFAAAPVPALLAKERAARRAAAIDMQRAAADVEPDRLAGLTTGPGGDTVYLSAIDRDGNIVSLIQSIFHGFGSGLVAPGTGFALQNRGALFTLEPGHPNELAPASGRCTPSSPASCARTACASASASWAASTRRRRTRSSWPTSPISAWISSRRSRPGGSPSRRSRGWTCPWRRRSPKPAAAVWRREVIRSSWYRRARTCSATARR